MKKTLLFIFLQSPIFCLFSHGSFQNNSTVSETDRQVETFIDSEESLRQYFVQDRKKWAEITLNLARNSSSNFYDRFSLLNRVKEHGPFDIRTEILPQAYIDLSQDAEDVADKLRTLEAGLSAARHQEMQKTIFTKIVEYINQDNTLGLSNKISFLSRCKIIHKDIIDTILIPALINLATTDNASLEHKKQALDAAARESQTENTALGRAFVHLAKQHQDPQKQVNLLKRAALFFPTHSLIDQLIAPLLLRAIDNTSNIKPKLVLIKNIGAYERSGTTISSNHLNTTNYLRKQICAPALFQLFSRVKKNTNKFIILKTALDFETECENIKFDVVQKMIELTKQNLSPEDQFAILKTASKTKLHYKKRTQLAPALFALAQNCPSTIQSKVLALAQECESLTIRKKEVRRWHTRD